MKITDLLNNPNPLANSYSDFHVRDKILLTGHSHQAWPDIAKEGILQSYLDAATFVDDKWERAFQKADEVRNGFAKLINDSSNNFAISSNTHELLIRFLSSLDLANKNKIITTDGEFHTVRRQLDVLNNKLINLVKVSRANISNLSEQIAEQIDNKTSAVIISKVMFYDAAIVENLDLIAEKCENFGAFLLIDAYHALNAIPFDIIEEKLQSAFIIGGGYKYMQLGEGNCFLRIPENYPNRPLITGWFSEFTALAEKDKAIVSYGSNHWLFAGATYDTVSNYRASEVLNFFKKNDLNINLLRELSLIQISKLNQLFDESKFDPTIISRPKNDINKHGAFTVFQSKYAQQITSRLKNLNVYIDYRGDNIRFGPAPYSSLNQLETAMEKLQFIIKNGDLK